MENNENEVIVKKVVEVKFEQKQFEALLSAIILGSDKALSNKSLLTAQAIIKNALENGDTDE